MRRDARRTATLIGRFGTNSAFVERDVLPFERRREERVTLVE